jgi:hypothetical protein
VDLWRRPESSVVARDRKIGFHLQVHFGAQKDPLYQEGEGLDPFFQSGDNFEVSISSLAELV